MDGCYRLSRLEELSISHNKLKDVQLLPSKFPCVDSLDLRNNLLSKVESLAPLASLPDLIMLSVEGNPLCSTQRYFNVWASKFQSHVDEIKKLLPNLKQLDDYEIESQENIPEFIDQLKLDLSMDLDSLLSDYRQKTQQPNVVIKEKQKVDELLARKRKEVKEERKAKMEQLLNPPNHTTIKVMTAEEAEELMRNWKRQTQDVMTRMQGLLSKITSSVKELQSLATSQQQSEETSQQITQDDEDDDSMEDDSFVSTSVTSEHIREALKQARPKTATSRKVDVEPPLNRPKSAHTRLREAQAFSKVYSRKTEEKPKETISTVSARPKRDTKAVLSTLKTAAKRGALTESDKRGLRPKKRIPVKKTPNK